MPDGLVGGTASDGDTTIPESVRPSLVKLNEDLKRERDRLLAGFENRRAVVEWAQRLTVRTMGRLPNRWYDDLAEQFLPADGMERTLLAALLSDESRRRPLDTEAARRDRERIAGVIMRQAHHRAFGYLRADAHEYTDVEDTSQNPLKQRYIAMRPALDELDEYQHRTLAALLNGFPDRTAILDWGDDMELATHGQVAESFLTRCYEEESTVRNLLCADTEAADRERALFAATYLLPAYNAGVRDLTGFSGESAAETNRGISSDQIGRG